ncbi:baeRF7 domain-containing protein [Tellurirhabdus bombi]|uniref:baeRF7 domain-containing protein n=1 Tax=Tellurirhabdus bombi TaxID=2907205 RepID=UPI001F1E8EAE|nr:hypothetical protein [Tellurirhabdus bombi]
MVLINSGKEKLLELAEQKHKHSISIFMPTHRRGKEVLERQDALTFKNHIQTARQTLKSQEVRPEEIDELMQPLETLLDDPNFWRHQQEGLAAFRNPDYFAVYHSPLPLENTFHINSRFLLQPLLPFAQPFPEYYVLQLGKNGVALYRANYFSIVPLDSEEEMPSSMDKVTKYYRFEKELQGFNAGMAGQGGVAAMYTSDDLANKEKNHLLADFFRLIDEGIRNLIGDQNAPLVIASVEYLQPIYREVNTYPHLHESGLTGNFDNVDINEIHRMANELLGDSLETKRQLRIEQYQNNNDNGLGSTDIRELLEAAASARIEALFVQTHTDVWGHFDEETMALTIHDSQQEESESLIDKLALLTMRYNGEVYVLDEVNLLGQQEPITAAALFRF